MKRLLIVFLSAVSTLAAEESQTMSVDAFLEQAMQKDTRFQRLLVDRLDWKYRQVLAVDSADWMLDVMADYSVNLNDTDADKPASVDVGVVKAFPFTGTNFQATLGVDGPGTDGDSLDWSLSISQDLAQNAFGRSARLASDLAAIGVELARFQLVEAYEDYLARLATLYVRWYLSQESLRTAQGASEESRKLLENIKQRKRRSVALQVDVDKVRLEVLTREEQELRLKTDYLARSLEIARALGRKDMQGIEAVDPSRAWSWDPGLVETFAKDSRTADLYAAAEKEGSLALQRLTDELLPSLSLGASYDGSRVGEFDPSSDIRVFLNLQLSLQRSQEKARKALAQNNLQKARLDTRDQLGRVLAALKVLDLEIETEGKRLEMAAEKIRLSTRILADESENYSYGRTSLSDLIRFSSRLEDDRFRLVELRSSRALMIIEALRLADRLVMKLPEK